MDLLIVMYLYKWLDRGMRKLLNDTLPFHKLFGLWFINTWYDPEMVSPCL